MLLRILIMARTNSHFIAPKLDRFGGVKSIDVEAGRYRLGEIVSVADVFDPSRVELVARQMAKELGDDPENWLDHRTSAETWMANEEPGPDGSPAFYRIYVTDWPDGPTLLDEARLWLENKHLSSIDGAPIAQRKRLVDSAKMPAAVRNALERDRFIETTMAAFKTYVQKRVDGQREVTVDDTDAPR